jgi:hypothetical protein
LASVLAWASDGTGQERGGIGLSAALLLQNEVLTMAWKRLERVGEVEGRSGRGRVPWEASRALARAVGVPEHDHAALARIVSKPIDAEELKAWTEPLEPSDALPVRLSDFGTVRVPQAARRAFLGKI